MHIHTQIRMHAHAEAHARACAHMHSHIHTHKHRRTHTHTYTHTRTHTHTNTHTPTHTDICIQGLFLGKVRVFVQHISKCFLSVLQEGLPCGAVVRSICQASWPRTSKQSQVWWVKGLHFIFIFLGVCMAGWEWMCEWMSLQCHSCVQTLDRGERCLGPDLQCPW